MNDTASVLRGDARFVIAIQPDVLPHQSFSARWVERFRELGHEVRLVNVRDPDVLERVLECDGFLWWFPPLGHSREPGKRLLSALDHATDLLVHPDWRSCWHFDDKVAQAYLLQAAGIAVPPTRVFWRYDDAIAFFRTARYPLVVKLSAGFRAENVGLLRDRAEAGRMAHRIFGGGIASLQPRPLGSLRDAARPLLNALRLRIGRAPVTPPLLQRDVLLVQEFAEGNDFDTRVTIIGDRAFVWRRGNRPNDFRASGFGQNDYEPSTLDAAAIQLAFRASQALGMPSMCADVLRRDGLPVLSEISFFFESWLIRKCPGHWRVGERLEWVDGPSSAEDLILDDFLARLRASRGQRSGPSRQ